MTRPQLAPIARQVQPRQRRYMTELVESVSATGRSAKTSIGAVGEMVNAALQGLLVGQLEAEKTQRRAALRFGDLLEDLL